MDFNGTDPIHQTNEFEIKLLTISSFIRGTIVIICHYIPFCPQNLPATSVTLFLCGSKSGKISCTFRRLLLQVPKMQAKNIFLWICLSEVSSLKMLIYQWWLLGPLPVFFLFSAYFMMGVLVYRECWKVPSFQQEPFHGKWWWSFQKTV